MSDARAPAMDVHMTPQDAGMARSFWLILSALLIGVNGYVITVALSCLVNRHVQPLLPLLWTNGTLRRTQTARNKRPVQL
jgi:hypothetical protein